MPMTKTERAELRSVVKQQFKILRREVEQRETELSAELASEITDHYHTEDIEYGRATAKAQEIVAKANDDIAAVFRDLYGDALVRGHFVTAHLPRQDIRRRVRLEHDGLREIRARASDARLQLDRQEADLLRTLAVGALESDEARSFLADIPAVGELVPAARLAELEAALPDDDDDLGYGRV